MATGDIDLCPLSCDGQISSCPTDMSLSRPFFEPNEQLQLLTTIPACGQKNAIGSQSYEQIERFPLNYPGACSVPERQTISRVISAARSADLTISTRSTSTVHPLQVFGFCRIIPNDAQSGWRAIVFCYFESIIRSMSRSNVIEEIARIRSFGCLVEAAGNADDSWLYEKTAGETISFLKDLHNTVNCPLQSRADLLMRRFNNTKISNSIIIHLRLISSLWAAAHAQTYEGLIPEGVSLDEYREKTLEAHNGQLDILGAAILVDWLLNPMGIKLNIVTLGGKGLFKTLDEHLLTTRFAQSVSSVGTCHLLYRYDHYDILYTQDYSGIDGNGGTITCKRARPPSEVKDGKLVESPPTISVSSAPGSKSRYETNTTKRYDHLDLMVRIFQMPTDTGIKTLITDAAIDVDSHPNIEKIQNSSENKTHPDNASRKRVSSGQPSRVRLDSRNTHVFPRYSVASDSSLKPSVHGMASSEIDQNLQALKALNPITASMDIPNFDRVNDTGSEDEEDGDAECETAELESNFRRIWTSLESGYCIGQDLLEMVLERTRIELLEGIMEQFWMYVNQRMGGGIRMHADPSSTSQTATSGSLNARTGISTVGSGKRNLEDEGQESPEEDDERRAKKPRTPAVSRDALKKSAQFACPYRKHDPRKYNFRDWSTCALSPLRTVARVKGHLYRYHRIHQCPRCKEVLESQEKLDAHVISPKGCDLRLPNLSESVEGINSRLKEQLQCRKKAYPGQTEAERWQQMYRLIFPEDKIVPSPYFEAIRDEQDNGPQSPDFEELAKYEQYLRTEIPRCFKRALECAIDNEIRGVGDRLRDRLFTLLQEAQVEAFGMYRADQFIDEGMVPPSSPPGQNSDYSGGNEDNIGLRVGQEFQDSLQIPVPPRSTSQTFDHNNLDFDEGFGFEGSEIPINKSTCSKSDPLPVKDSVETTSNQNVAGQQFELGSSNCSYDHLSFPEIMDSDLFDLNPQLGANADIRA